MATHVASHDLAGATDEKYVFKGSENPLLYSRHHNIEFQCNFDMTYYPFDVQQCRMIFLRVGDGGKFKLLPDLGGRALRYLGERELMQYHIDEWVLDAQSGWVCLFIFLSRSSCLS